MAKNAVEQVFDGSLLSVEPGDAYDPDKIYPDELIRQWNLGGGALDKFVGPTPVTVLRPNEATQAIPVGFVHVHQFSSTEWWIFYSDNAAAAATRRFGLYTYNPKTAAASWQGFITVTPPTTGNVTIRGFRAITYRYSTGTVAVSGTAVTGTSTAWQTAGFAVGSRIGFGSTDPTAITTWYQVTARASDTGITIGTSAGTISAGTAFCLEETRIVYAATNATATNGGLFVVKGLNKGVFISAGTAIPAATTVDNIRAAYWIKDAATVTLTTATGVAIAPQVSDTLHDCYLLQGGASSSITIHRYNMRAALTLTAGAATFTAGVNMTLTGAQTVTGTVNQLNNVRYGVLNHGPGNGVASLYFCSTTRILRVALTNITTGNVTWLSDQMVETPPGNANSFVVTGTLASCEISDALDRLVVTTTSGDRAFLTQYRTDSGAMDRGYFANTRQTDPSTVDSGTTPQPGANTSALSMWSEAGMFFVARQGTTSPLSTIHIFPGGADWAYAPATGNRVILPRINLGAVPAKFYRVLATEAAHLGSDTLGHSTEAHRIKYRTAGITDNSGSWTDVPVNGDMSGVSAASSIQFAFNFKTLGDACVPARMLSLALLYESATELPSQYRWSYTDSNPTDGTFGFIQGSLFGTAIGVHTINIYRADTNALVLTQASSGSTNGVFQVFSGSWGAGLGTDVVGTRRRFVPSAGLPAGIDLYATITVA